MNDMIITIKWSGQNYVNGSWYPNSYTVKIYLSDGNLILDGMPCGSGSFKISTE